MYVRQFLETDSELHERKIVKLAYGINFYICMLIVVNSSPVDTLMWLVVCSFS